jgi:hypothetical protein
MIINPQSALIERIIGGDDEMFEVVVHEALRNDVSESYRNAKFTEMFGWLGVYILEHIKLNNGY